MLQSMGLQRGGHKGVTELNWKKHCCPSGRKVYLNVNGFMTQVSFKTLFFALTLDLASVSGRFI